MSDDQIEKEPPPEVDDPAPSPLPPPLPPNGNGVQAETISDAVRRAREVIPVGDRGVNPQTYAQWIDIAKDVCKAYLMLPPHLHNNAPVVAGLLEIAARFRLSAYMLAGQSYEQNGRLCFQAQAFGALLYASGLLHGRLKFEFHGEGEDLTCTVSGRFKDDPDAVYSATTPTLKQIHPGHRQKDGKTFVKGSPLFDKDPEQQLVYFGERRWIRRHAPDVCMGMYTREEIIDIDGYRVERDGSIPLSADRLGQLDTGEGWGDGAHVDIDLASIQPEPAPEVHQEEPIEIAKPRKAAAPPARKPVGARKPVAHPKAARQPKNAPARPARRPQAPPPTRAQVQAVANRAKKPPAPRTPPALKWFDYVTRAEAWIKELAADQAPQAEGRWEGEREERDKAQVPIGERSRLRALLDRKLAQLSSKVKE